MSGAVEVVIALSAGRKANQLYPPEHPAFVEAIQAIVTSVAARHGGWPVPAQPAQGTPLPGKRRAPRRCARSPLDAGGVRDSQDREHDAPPGTSLCRGDLARPGAQPENITGARGPGRARSARRRTRHACGPRGRGQRGTRGARTPASEGPSTVQQARGHLERGLDPGLEGGRHRPLRRLGRGRFDPETPAGRPVGRPRACHDPRTVGGEPVPLHQRDDLLPDTGIGPRSARRRSLLTWALSAPPRHRQGGIRRPRPRPGRTHAQDASADRG